MVVRMIRQLPASEVKPVLLKEIFQRSLCTSELVFSKRELLTGALIDHIEAPGGGPAGDERVVAGDIDERR